MQGRSRSSFFFKGIVIALGTFTTIHFDLLSLPFGLILLVSIFLLFIKDGRFNLSVSGPILPKKAPTADGFLFSSGLLFIFQSSQFVNRPGTPDWLTNLSVGLIIMGVLMIGLSFFKKEFRI